MVAVPIIERLTVRSYGLYSRGGDEVDFDFDSNLTIVLGANGLGKSTLINLTHRMLTGPVDIADGESDSLGTASLRVRALTNARRHLFAARVSDHAVTASATVRVRFESDGWVAITRRLDTLRLIEAVADNGQSITVEEELQALLVMRAELGSFSDWLLLLRYVVFFQENRRALIWDPAAQRQILRPLFLAPAEANEWVELERAILRFDSESRNLRAVLGRLEPTVADDSGTLTSREVRALRRRLQTVRDRLAAAEVALEDVSTELTDAESEREDARLAWLAAEDALDGARREYERSKLLFIGARLPDLDATTSYLYSLLLSGDQCAACGAQAPALNEELEQRLRRGQCLVCGSDVVPDPTPVPSVTERRIDVLLAAVDERRERVEATRSRVEVAEGRYAELLESSRLARREAAALEQRSSDLMSQLPPEAAGQIDELRILRNRLTLSEANLEEARVNFQAFVVDKTRQILQRADDLEFSFRRYASSFLVEQSRLTWSAEPTRIGQSGPRFPLPQYKLMMTGSDFPDATLRDSVEDVSESQREFIDLAFRMALIAVASRGGAGTLLIDDPGSSLDAVFERKAAQVLNDFASSAVDSHLVVTANLSSGEFVPELVHRFRQRNTVNPLVLDLLEIATPTAAFEEFRAQYEVERDRVLEESGL